MTSMWSTPKPLQSFTVKETNKIPDKEEEEREKPSASTTQHDLPEDAHIQDDQVNDSNFS